MHINRLNVVCSCSFSISYYHLLQHCRSYWMDDDDDGVVAGWVIICITIHIYIPGTTNNKQAFHTWININALQTDDEQSVRIVFNDRNMLCIKITLSIANIKYDTHMWRTCFRSNLMTMYGICVYETSDRHNGWIHFMCILAAATALAPEATASAVTYYRYHHWKQQQRQQFTALMWCSNEWYCCKSQLIVASARALTHTQRENKRKREQSNGNGME